jgi:hypothetical protein
MEIILAYVFFASFCFAETEAKAAQPFIPPFGLPG